MAAAALGKQTKLKLMTDCGSLYACKLCVPHGTSMMRAWANQSKSQDNPLPLRHKLTQRMLHASTRSSSVGAATSLCVPRVVSQIAAEAADYCYYYY